MRLFPPARACSARLAAVALRLPAMIRPMRRKDRCSCCHRRHQLSRDSFTVPSSTAYTLPADDAVPAAFEAPRPSLFDAQPAESSGNSRQRKNTIAFRARIVFYDLIFAPLLLLSLIVAPYAHGSWLAGIRMPERMLEYSHRNHSSPF